MTTATTESLFIKKVSPYDLFEKEATIARMPDDDKKWPEVVLSELHKQLPFMSGMDVSLNLTRIQPEAGYGFGYALVRGQKNAVNLPTPKSENQMVRIPIVIADRHLEPFHVFNFESRTLPLTQSRFEEALENPRMFAGPDSTPKTEKSLIDQMYPPYQQRQGFGRVVDGSGMSGSSMGINKVATAIENMTPDEIERLSKLRRYANLDKARAGLSRQDRLTEEKDAIVQSSMTGGFMGGLRGAIANARNKRAVLSSLGANTMTGAGIGLGTGLAGQTIKRLKARGRKKDRESETYSEYFKEAAAEDIENFRPAENPDVSCKTCKFYGSSTETGSGMCNKFSADVKENMVCDSWEANNSPDKLASYTKYLMGARR